MSYALSLYRSHKKRNFTEPVIDNSFNLVSDKAIEQLRKRGANILTTEKWNDLENETHDKAFTVANVMSADIVQEVYDYVERAVSDGWSFDTFKKKVKDGDLVDRMKKAGWTGESPNRLKVIYDTNISLAQGKGKYQRLMLNIDAKPYGIYHQLDRRSKNKDHEKWNGKKFKLDDPIWNIIMPPSAFGCACWIQATDDPTGVESGSDYMDNLDTNDYPLSPVKAWKPDTDKYVEGIQDKLKDILLNKNESHRYKIISNGVKDYNSKTLVQYADTINNKLTILGLNPITNIEIDNEISYGFDTQRNKLVVSETMLKDENSWIKYKESMKKRIAPSLLDKDINVFKESVLEHELSHFLLYAIDSNLNLDGQLDFSNGLAKLFEKYIEDYDPYESLPESILSKYSTVNQHEMVAEALSLLKTKLTDRETIVGDILDYLVNFLTDNGLSEIATNITNYYK